MKTSTSAEAMPALSALVAVAALLLAPPVRAAASAVEAPSPEGVREARQLVEAMKQSDRGPYVAIRWFCEDGTNHPARPYPCEERGGGIQHAQYSPQRARLAELGWHVGTIIAATSWDELWDPAHRNARLRELALERYMVDVDDGWVLRKAQHYRGRVQVEDEEQQGYEYLVKLLSDSEWVTDEFLLARELVRAIPHHGGSDRTREVRRLSKDLAIRDPSFEKLRVKIHNEPGAEDAAATRRWSKDAAARGSAVAIVAAGEQLADELDQLYGRQGRAARFAAASKVLATVEGGGLERLLSGVLEAPPESRTARLGELLAKIRTSVSSSRDGAGNLKLLDLSVEAEDELLLAAREARGDRESTRKHALSLARDLARAAHGSGLLSARELEAVAGPVESLLSRDEAPTSEYRDAAEALERTSGWALNAVRHAFAEPLARYSALEPKAVQFPDDLLRGSALLPLAEIAGDLARDAERLSGTAHVVLGRRASGLSGLNPGAASGPLRWVSEEDLARGAPLRTDEIVVLPRTVSELTPVAGIITVAEGNVLSHVQLLARNLGIPNATIPSSAAQGLRESAGQRVVYAVGSDGSVVLELESAVPAEARAALRREADTPPTLVDAPVPDLSVKRFLRLADLHAGISGELVGPKAANVGELNRQFPGRVAPALAIPFGIYFEHVDGPGPKSRLDAAFARSRAGEIDDAALAAEVEAVRKAVEATPFSARRRSELGRVMEEEFGAPGTYGVFVRSDTNAEDLPGFTGAGLNKTVPHVVGTDAIVAAVPQVWASPFTARAMSWRKRALTRPEEVYPSVLLMKSVPSTKSGVLVTSDVATGGEGATVAVAWGVGGAVDSEEAETLVLRDDGTVLLVSEGKAPYARRLAARGGVEWVPAPTGTILAPKEIAELRKLVGELRERLEPELDELGKPLPWDVEFGFVDGELALFQVRPLVERGALKADRVVRSIAPVGRAAVDTVRLDERLGGGRIAKAAALDRATTASTE